MASKSLNQADIILTDGKDEIIYTNDKPTKMPTTDKQKQKAGERKAKVGGQARTCRLKKKSLVARKRAAKLIYPFTGSLEWRPIKGLDFEFDFEFDFLE